MKSQMLTVAFYHHSYRTQEDYELHSALMDRAVRAVRKHMPFAQICHLKGNKTPSYPAAERVISYNQFGERPHHHSLVPKGNVLFLDVDCMVRADVFDVFAKGFDVAFCVRPQFDHEKPETWLDPAFNCGVIFSRSPEFWKDFAAYHKNEDCPWRDEILSRYVRQHAVKKYMVTFLPGKTYNYTPREWDEDLTGRAIVHYKGEKKKYWMKHAFG